MDNSKLRDALVNEYSGEIVLRSRFFSNEEGEL